MYAVTTALKWVAILAAVGLAGWFGYTWYTKEPPGGADVADAVRNIAAVVGDETVELSRAEGRKVEHQLEELEGYDMQLIADGFAEFPSPTVAQEVAAELILLRIYQSRPGGYRSRIIGDPWEVSGKLINLSMFEIDRNEAETVPLTIMVKAFVASSSVRPKWTGATDVHFPEPAGPEESEEAVKN